MGTELMQEVRARSVPGLTAVPDCDALDALVALDAAHTAQPSWAATPPRERGKVLRGAVEALIAPADYLALLMTLEMGKPIHESRAEIAYAVEFLRWYDLKPAQLT